MTDDLGARIRQHYTSAASSVTADEAIERHTVRGEEALPRRNLSGWFGRHPAAAVGAAALATLLVVGGTLLALRSEPQEFVLSTTPAVEVNGESTCAVRRIGTWTGDPLPGGFTTQQRGQVNACVTDTSDPRVNGTWDVALNCDYSLADDTTVGQCWGTLELESGSGGWEGTFTAITESSVDALDDIFHIIDADVVGTGDYVGLRYIHRIEGTDLMTVTGRIGPVDALGPTTTGSP